MGQQHNVQLLYLCALNGTATPSNSVSLSHSTTQSCKVFNIPTTQSCKGVQRLKVAKVFNIPFNVALDVQRRTQRRTLCCCPIQRRTVALGVVVPFNDALKVIAAVPTTQSCTLCCYDARRRAPRCTRCSMTRSTSLCCCPIQRRGIQ